MAIEFRPATPAEMPAFVYADRVGFGQSTAPEEIERMLQRMSVKAEMTLCAFDNGTPVANYAAFPFVMNWNGSDVRCAGVTDVSTQPTYRRRGLLREIMTRAFAGMREEGVPVAMLWASMAAIYQRFGYGIAYTMHTYDFDPRHLRFVDELPVSGRTRLVKASEAVPVIAPAYARFAAQRTLMVRRGTESWPWALDRPVGPGIAPSLVVTYEEDDEVLGYAVYGIESRSSPNPGPWQQLNVTDLVWLTPAAHRALVQHFIGHDLVYSVYCWRMPIDDPLLFSAQEPRLLNARVWDGTLVRIVDLPAALEARGYDADGRLTFSLADDLCPWNSGTWELTVEGGRARVVPASGDGALCLSPRVLAVLAAGRQNATTLAHIGQLSAADSRALRTADALFATACAPLCLDMF